VIVVLALSMGIQNAAARTLAVPDLTTTGLTLTVTGIAADSTLSGGTGPKRAAATVPGERHHRSAGHPPAAMA
jgi:hypothetical protein